MRWMVLAFLSFAAVGPAAQMHLRFSGSVSAGEHFRKAIGRGLAFELIPDDGWDIQIRRASPPGEGDEMTGCVTFPLHGPTPLQITAWQISGREKFPHSFDFTLTSADQTRACAEMNIVVETARQPKKDPVTGMITVGTPGYRSPPLGHGKLVVSEVQLSPAAAGKQAAIQSMSFEVEVWMPLT